MQLGSRPRASGLAGSAQPLQEEDDGFDPAVEVGDVELLVGGVQVIVGEAEAHHHAGDLQVLLEVGRSEERRVGKECRL